MPLPRSASLLRWFRSRHDQATFSACFLEQPKRSIALASSELPVRSDEPERSSKRIRVFSGIQPTGNLHLGNYLGAVALWKDLQDSADKSLIISVVDMHAITLAWKPEVLKRNIVQMFVQLMACGIDPDRSLLFLQSMVPEHCQLQWIFSCLTTLARIDNLPHFKEKSTPAQPKKVADGEPPQQIDAGCGLLMYPILQAADILLYKREHVTCDATHSNRTQAGLVGPRLAVTTLLSVWSYEKNERTMLHLFRSQLVPVGEDQIHHLQLAQHIARVFNNKHGKYFSYPERLHSEQPRVKSLRDPLKKMSKSDVDVKSRIDLTDSPDQISSKFKKAITDSTSAVEYDPENRPGMANLISLYQTVTGRSLETIQREIAPLDKVAFKARLAEAVIEMLRPIQEKIVSLNEDLQFVEKTVETGSQRARSVAEVTIREVFDLVGFTCSSSFSVGVDKKGLTLAASEMHAKREKSRIKC